MALSSAVIAGGFCALHAGLHEVPVVRNTISYRNDREAFLRLLLDANEQRKKSAGMQLREAAMRIDPKEAVQAMRAERKERDEQLLDRSDDTIMEASGGPKRWKISKGSMPFLEAALRVANENRDYWPLSVRQIHYRLLNDPPLKFTPKGKSTSQKDRRYANDESSYKALVNCWLGPGWKGCSHGQPSMTRRAQRSSTTIIGTRRRSLRANSVTS